MAGLLWTYRIIVAMMAGAIVYSFYASDPGTTMRLQPGVYWGVLGLVLAEPVALAAVHLFGGVVMGVAAGGIIDGLKLSCIIGIGRGVGRLWLAVLAAALGVYAAGGPLLYSVGGVILAAVLFGLDRALTWFWSQAKPELNTF